MYVWHWSSLYNYLPPFLTGVCLLMTICRALMLWQKARSAAAIWHMLVYFSLFVLFLFRSLELGIAEISLAYLLLSVVLVACNLYEWPNFVQFLRQKNAVFNGDFVPEVRTLEALTKAPGNNITIEATPKVTPVEPLPVEPVKEG